MADNPNHEIKKHKKKHKKKHRKPKEEAEPANVEAADSKQESAMDESPESTKPLNEELAANTKYLTPEADPVAPQLAHDDKVRLLEEVQKFASNFNRRNSCLRVEWDKISLEGFTQFRLQEEYKRLTKGVRKLRTIGEIVTDAQKVLQETKESAGRVPLVKKGKGPSKPSNSFMMFCKAKRPSLVEKHPELSFGEIHKKICERWKVTSSSKREKYVKKYEKAKLLYTEELKKFQEEQLSRIKKPLAAYDMWKLERQRDKDLDGDEIEDDFLVEWDNLPNSMKKGWIQAANSEKERYDSERACIYTQSHLKVKKSTKSTEKDTSTSDEAQGQKLGKKKQSFNDEHQTSPSTSQKRKLDNSSTADVSPRKRVSKQPESSPEKGSESSSNDE